MTLHCSHSALLHIFPRRVFQAAECTVTVQNYSLTDRSSKFVKQCRTCSITYGLRRVSTDYIVLLLHTSPLANSITFDWLSCQRKLPGICAARRVKYAAVDLVINMAFYRWSSNPIQLAWSVRNNMENHSLASFIQLLSFSTEGREKTFSIPIEKLDFAYSRCSGPGMDYEYFHHVLREVVHAYNRVKQ